MREETGLEVRQAPAEVHAGQEQNQDVSLHLRPYHLPGPQFPFLSEEGMGPADL